VLQHTVRCWRCQRLGPLAAPDHAALIGGQAVILRAGQWRHLLNL
jgi:hypothetical protein